MTILEYISWFKSEYDCISRVPLTHLCIPKEYLDWLQRLACGTVSDKFYGMWVHCTKDVADIEMYTDEEWKAIK